MNDIPEENWERAFSKHDGGWVEEQLDNQDGLMVSPETQKILFDSVEKIVSVNPLDHEQTH